MNYYVGSCPHDIEADFYKSDESTYMVIDGPTGVSVNVTTCRECRADAEASGSIVDPLDLDVDDFENPFADDEPSGIINVINLDGSTTVVDLDKKEVV